MSTTSRSPSTRARLAIGTLVIAVAGTLAQSAWAAPGHRGDGGFMGGPMQGAMQGRMVDRMLDTVNATAEQRLQVKKITDAAQADRLAQRESHRALREQGMKLFTQPTVDANAAEVLRQQMMQQHDQASRRRLQTMLDVSRVLTPEQRKLLADRMAQRGEMMQRHQHERRSLQGGPAPR